MAGEGKHLLHVFATFGAGGPQVRAVQLLAMLGPEYRHTIVAMDGCRDCGLQVPSAINVDYLSPPGGGGFLAMGLAFRGLLRRCRPDLLLTYNWGASEALLGARLARFRPVVHHEDGFGPEEVERFLRRRIWLRRLLFPGARAIIVPSRTLQRVAREHWRPHPERLFYLPNGVDTQRFQPRENPAEKPLTIGSVGGLRGEKNQDLLLRAFAMADCHRNSRLLLVGDGPKRQDLEQLVGQLGLTGQVEFAGALADTAPVYAEMDICALSSRTEQMPVVVLEAMASGLPIVSTRVGDVGEMVGVGNQPFMVPPGDERALAAALDRLAMAAELRKEVGRENRERVLAEFPLQECYGRYLSVYQGAM